MDHAEAQYEYLGEKVRLFGETNHAAKMWDKERRVIINLERFEEYFNTYIVATNLSDGPQKICDDFYAIRGGMKNRNKERQMMLFADAIGCHDFQANQFELLLSTFA